MKYKDYYDDKYIYYFSSKIHSVMPSFNLQVFSNDLIGRLDDKELFTRFDYIVVACKRAWEVIIQKISNHFMICWVRN
jgi:hypothetical protein